MAGYLGNKPKLANYAVDEFTTSAAQASSGNFTLSQTVTDERSLEVSVGGIDQPQSAYTVTGTTLAFGASIVAENDIVIARHAGESLMYPTLEAGAVTDVKMASSGTMPAWNGSALTGIVHTPANDSVDGAQLSPPLVTGDIIYADGTDSIARLAKGTNGQVLKMGVSIPAWGTDSAVDLTADQSWTGSQRATLAAPTWSAPNLTFDLNAGQNFSYTTVANTTINFSNIPNGQSGYIIFTNGGTHTIAKAATTKTDANLLATISVTGQYILSYISDGTNAYLTNSAIMA
jgi:hypothetical protein